MIISFIGPDGTGKSNIAAALSGAIVAPVFKNKNEWHTELDSPTYFSNLLEFGGPFLMDFLSQTSPHVILDRFYPCEKVYASVFNRETNNDLIDKLDARFADIGGRFVLCLKKNYGNVVDEVYPDALSCDVLQKLDSEYRKFASQTLCKCLVLETDDEDLTKQLATIKKFLGE